MFTIDIEAKKNKLMPTSLDYMGASYVNVKGNVIFPSPVNGRSTDLVHNILLIYSALSSLSENLLLLITRYFDNCLDRSIQRHP